MTKVSSFFSTCGLSSVRAEVAATYHLSPFWILSAMSAPLQVFIDLDVPARHHRGGEPLLEGCAAAAAVDAVDATCRGDRLQLTVYDVDAEAVIQNPGHRTPGLAD